MSRLLLILALLAGLLAGCSKPAASNDATSAPPAAIKLGYLVKQPEEPWFQFEWQGAERAAAKLGFTLVKISAPDGEKALTAIDSLAAAGAQGFVICTPDVRLGPAIVAKAGAAGLKVIAVDDRFLAADGSFIATVPYLGLSAARIGELSGRSLAEERRRRGWTDADTAACVVTFDELDTCRERTDGVIAALRAAGFPAERIFRTAQRTTDIPGGFDSANALLAQHAGVKHWLVAGMNDSAVLGAVRATEGAGFAAADVIGVGIGGADCRDEFHKPAPTGFYGSIYASAVQEGELAASLLYHWVKDGQTPPPDTRAEGRLITRENYQQVLRADGVL